MAHDIYSTGAIRGVIRSLPVPQPFLFKHFFRNVILSQEEEIMFDVEVKRERVMPFVAPHIPGKLVDSNGYYTDKFKPAMLKDLRTLDPKRPLKRLMGEQIGGASSVSPAQRAAALLQQELQDQVEMSWRRFEVMAADALMDGIVTVTGEGYAAVAVNFGRPNGHTVGLTSTAEWGETGVSPVKNLEAWSLTYLSNSGLQVTDVVFGTRAWQLFRDDPLFEKIVDTTFRGSDASGMASVSPMIGGQLVGKLNGTVNLWVYSQWWIDPADNTKKAIIPDASVILGNNTPDGAQTAGFGVIQDELLGYPAEMFAARSWVENNPAVRHLLGQSAPLPILSRPAATFFALVRDD